MQPYKNYEGGYSYTIQEFGGLNERLRCSDNEFARMENMSLKQYPVLTVRDKKLVLDDFKKENIHVETVLAIGYHGKHIRVIREANLNTMQMEVNLYINGSKHLTAAEFLDPEIVDTPISAKIVGMGANIILLPYKISFDVQNTTLGYYEFCEPVENVFSTALVNMEPCTLNGEIYTAKSIGKTAPLNPENGDVWVDTSKETSSYKVWDSSTKQWVGVATTYIKLSYEGIGEGFKKWDSVDMRRNQQITEGVIFEKLGGNMIKGDLFKRLKEQIHNFLNVGSKTVGLRENKRTIIYDAFHNEDAPEEDYLIISGLLDQPCAIAFHIERKMFDSPFYFEHNNRLWGCAYGYGENEIRASKQGDCTNWDSYLGISSDSYAVTVGVPGEFTGGISFGGYPMFFKENCIIKIYGSQPSNYQVITTPCMGVEKGMENSLVVANGILYYKSTRCFCAYDGSMPVNISNKIKNVKYKDIKAGATDKHVYFACTEESGESYMLVFDISSGIWTRESSEEILCFVRDTKGLNFIERDGIEHSEGVYLKSIDDVYDEKSVTNDNLFPIVEEDFNWHFESGDIGLADINLKYIKKLLIRANVHTGAHFKVSVRSNNGPFLQCGEKVFSPGVSTVGIPLSLERCEKFRYRIEGNGRVDFYSINYEYKEGSDKR